MEKVINEKQEPNEIAKEECGLRNEMDFWKHRY